MRKSKLWEGDGGQLDNMKRNRFLLEHNQFLEYIRLNSEAEKERIFCGHGLNHALEVALAASRMALAEKLPIKEDIVYAAGLLHDIGRWREYAYGEDHALASSKLAVEILRDCGYNLIEEAMILEAINGHRTRRSQNQSLTDILYRSDKIVRPCALCRAREQCKYHIK